MKKNYSFVSLPFAVMFCGSLALSPLFLSAQEPGKGSDAQIDLRVHTGYSSYEEHVSIDPTDSEWTGATVGFGAVFRAKQPDYHANIHLDYFTSLEDTEEWTSRGFLAQRNDLSLSGVMLLGELGYPVPVKEGTDLILLGGLGFRYNQFSRSNFQTAAVGFDDLGRVDEDYKLIYLNGALALEHAFSENNGMRLRGDLGWIVFNEAENSLIGDGPLEGDGGFIFRLAADWYWQIKPNQKLSIGVILDHQENNGTVDSFNVIDPSVGLQSFIVEWPDNELDRISLAGSWTFLF